MSSLVEPTYSHIPEYHKTFGPEVADLCDQAHFPPDPQQRLALDVMFARQSDGRSAAYEIAIICCRQNLKSATFKQASLGWLFLFDERLIVYSAHDFYTSLEIFRDMEALVSGADFLRREVKRIVRSHGEESVELRSGARMIFRTRTKGSGRGLSGSKVVLDEAYALRAMHMGALLPTLSAQPDPQVVYGSAAGMADSDVLRDVRDRGRGVGRDTRTADPDPRLAYLEWAAPPPAVACEAGTGCTHAKNARGCGCDKPDLWLKANPTIGDRMSLEYVAAERRAMPPEEFTRERMGWWDEPLTGASPIVLAQWYACADKASTPAAGSALALAIAVAQDSSMAAIAIAGWREDDVPHVELVEHLPGTGWLIERLMGIVERRKPCVVVLDPSSQAGSFDKELRARGFVTKALTEKPLRVPAGKHLLMTPGSREVAQACGALANSVTNSKIRHPDQRPLNKAVEDGRGRPSAGAWSWNTSSPKDITPLVAVTLANLGLVTYGVREPPEPFFLV